MDELLPTLAIAIAAFASTNIDDLLLLSSLFVDAEFQTLSVIVGQFLGMSLLVLISILAALFTITIPREWIGLLGFAPLFLGVYRLWKLLNGRPEKSRMKCNAQDFIGKERIKIASVHSEVLLATLLTVANGGDNLSVYVPLFSVQRASMSFYALVFAMMTAIWCLLGYHLTNHRMWREWLKRYARFVIPFILIAIGLNVLSLHR
jgi:cadmium resistance protein CadD (predicted permease)